MLFPSIPASSISSAFPLVSYTSIESMLILSTSHSSSAWTINGVNNINRIIIILIPF